MKRSDRLMAIVIALQQRSETAQSLANKLEVSKRTIIRDMQALSEMGVPLYAESGPSGGYRLMEGYKLSPLQFDQQEALAVLFALNAMTRMADTPFSHARYTALDKIRAVLPDQILQQIEPLLDHVEMEVPDRRYETPFLKDLLTYSVESVWVRALYRSEKHERWLELLPCRVYTAYGFWYCEAYSEQHKEKRNFRVDRFQQLEALDRTEGPDENEHEARDDNQSYQPIRIQAYLTYRGALLAEQDPHIGHQVQHVDDDRWWLDFMCPASEWRWAVQLFYTLGMDAEVIEPVELKQDILRKANEVSNRYRTDERT